MSLSAFKSIAVLCVFALLCAPVSAQDTIYKANPKFSAAMADGQRLMQQRQYVAAIAAYQKANKLAAGRDSDALKRILGLQLKTGAYPDAAATASSLAVIAANPGEKSAAEGARGQAFYLQAIVKDQGDLYRSADEALKAAIADDPKNGSAHFIEGHVLARLGQKTAAAEQFRLCLQYVSPNDPSYVRAQRFAANPELSMAKMAPAFTVVALDGTKFSLDRMDGRVVLIDFWATWCVPCNIELPELQRMAKEFAGQPFVVLSISWDADEGAWKDFVAKNGMTWPQYRDSTRGLSRLFGVDAIPHYFIIDSDGVLTSEMLGEGSDVEGKLKELIAKASAAQAAAHGAGE